MRDSVTVVIDKARREAGKDDMHNKNEEVMEKTINLGQRKGER